MSYNNNMFNNLKHFQETEILRLKRRYPYKHIRSFTKELTNTGSKFENHILITFGTRMKMQASM